MSDQLAGNVWTTARGKTLRIADMATSHLFYTVRMLWNHHAPVHLQFRPFKRYRLNMPRQYVLDSMAAMLAELRTRTDLSSDQAHVLNQMTNHFKKDKTDDQSTRPRVRSIS